MFYIFSLFLNVFFQTFLGLFFKVGCKYIGVKYVLRILTTLRDFLYLFVNATGDQCMAWCLVNHTVVKKLDASRVFK